MKWNFYKKIQIYTFKNPFEVKAMVWFSYSVMSYAKWLLHNLLTFFMKYKFSCLANRDVADYQSLLIQISRMRIHNKTIERRWHRIWTTLHSAIWSVKIPECNKSPSGNNFWEVRSLGFLCILLYLSTSIKTIYIIHTTVSAEKKLAPAVVAGYLRSYHFCSSMTDNRQSQSGTKK